MKRIIKSILIIILIVLLVKSRSKPPLAESGHTDIQRPVEGVQIGSKPPEFNDNLLNLVNDYRMRQGLQPLVENESLVEGAMDRAKYLSENDVFSHDGWVEFCRNYSDNRFMGENLARNFDNDWQVLGGWIASPTHKDLLDDKKYYYGGVGRHGKVFVLWFASKD